MKAFNVIALSMGGALLFAMSVAFLSEYFFGRDNGMLITIPLALAAGLSARRLTERFLGYTLLEAMKEGPDDARD